MKKKRANQDIHDFAKSCGIYIYEIAHELCLSESTITRMLRFEMTAEQKAKCINAIEAIAVKKKGNGMKISKKNA